MKKVTSIVLNPYINDSRVIKETQTLRKAGYEVSVLALHDDREGLAKYEVMDGLSLHRIKLVSKSWSKLPPVQVLKYIEFCVRAICEIKADIVHCNDLNALPVGYILKSILRCKKIVFLYILPFRHIHNHIRSFYAVSLLIPISYTIANSNYRINLLN